jgi:hypothetical protein
LIIFFIKKSFLIYNYLNIYEFKFIGDWGLGIGDWGLGCGGWGP